ncbi:MAG: M28 family peptidase [Chitinophagales bacterium]
MLHAPKKVLFFLCLFSISLFIQAQKSVREADLEEEIKNVPIVPAKPKPKDMALKYSKMVNQEDLKKHLTILASDEYGGRGTGQEGQKMAQKYIAKHFENLNLPKIGHKKTYYQPVSLINQEWGTPTIKVGKKKYEFLKDFYAFGQTTDDLDYTTKDVLFLGYGIEDDKYNDYKNQDVKGKTVMILMSEPTLKNGSYLINNSPEPSEWTMNWRKKVQIADEKLVDVLLIVVDNIEKQISRYGNYIKMGGMEVADGTKNSTKMSVVYISRKMADDILGNKKRKSTAFLQKKINKKAKTRSLQATTNLKIDLDKKIEVFDANNLLGYIEGSDPKLKDELVIVTAHYDHLGTDGEKIYNGADDDGSGTVAVLEIAQAFATAKADGNGAKRSVLVMPVTGEEKGLLGSEFYADIKPVFPLKNTVANLNVDMVGRIDNEHKDANYVYVIGSDKLSSELHNINENMNKKYTKLALDYKYNDDKDPNRFYYRSDHYNFAKHDIPIIFYFNGTHGDYHQTSDTVDKINFEGLEKRARLVFFTAWQLANQDKRIEVDKKTEK